MVRRTSLHLFVLVVFLSIGMIGCGGSEEAVLEDELVTDIGVTEETEEELPLEEEQTPQEEPVQQEEPAQQEESTPQEQTPQEQPVQEGPTKEQLQSELDALKTENLQLKDENSGLQQTNKDLTNKISDLEAANAALAANPKRSEPARVVERRPAIAGKSSPEEVRMYEGAVNMARNRNYRGAIDELQSLLSAGIKDDFADNSHYWIGECSFQLKDFSSAIQHFQQVLNYKYSEKRDDAQLMIAKSYERLGDKAKAREEYQKLIDLYPTSEYVKRARASLR